MIRQRSNVLIIIQLLQIKSKIIPSSKQSLLKTCHFYEISFFFCLITNTIEIKDSTKQNQYSESIYIYTHTHKSEPCHNKYFYVFRRFFACNDDVSWIEVFIKGRFLWSSLTRTNDDDFDDLIFSTSSNENGSGLIRIVNLGTIRRVDNSPELLCSLSVLDDRELIEEELDWRLERIVGRQRRKFGLFECGVFDNDVDDDEYWDEVRWRFWEYIGDEDENEEDEDVVDNVGERRRVGRVLIVDN